MAENEFDGSGIIRKNDLWTSPRRIIARPEGRKSVRSFFLPFEISLSQHHPSRILGWPEGRNEISGSYNSLKPRFLELAQVAFSTARKHKIISQSQASP
jgi:hypothetical protein